MSATSLSAKDSKYLSKNYTNFESLDGQHPWQKAVPEGVVTYQVRELNCGKVIYFNYVLAKEMGLLDKNHPHIMNPALENILQKTFSVQIINEYDELHKRRIPSSLIKPHRYMATRYLQLQHQNKQGRTSGDGRGIWNGTVSHRGLTWDVSSRGTGVTCLAPGAVLANKPLRTGTTDFGYGCGQAEIDELLGAAIMAELMHLQGIKTERVLCVIDLGKGVGIGVRAAPNLLRPAHLFLYLKQNKQDQLIRAVDYFIDRQIKNKQWIFKQKGPKKYDELGEFICETFAEFTAKLDTHYIFAWLDWDGDNVLADAGIIDYGSVRQFGIRHDRYRYDDVERFSTNLNEQKNKARLIVQVFLQMIDYIKCGHKKPLKYFMNEPLLKKFDARFNFHRSEQLLYKMGFSPKERNFLIQNHMSDFENFDAAFSYFERAKISGNAKKVADGINHPPLFNMRSIMIDLPKLYLNQKGPIEKRCVPADELYSKILSVYAKKQDTRIGKKQLKMIQKFQDSYKKLLSIIQNNNSERELLCRILKRSTQVNSEKRITGNALIEIVNELLDAQKKRDGKVDLQLLIDQLIIEHIGQPEIKQSLYYPKLLPLKEGQLFSRILDIVHQNRENI